MIIFTGVAGAGKSVQGQLLADNLGYLWLATGQLMRMFISGDRRREMLQGKLLDDQEIIFFVDGALKLLPDDNECILDGFPRTVHQVDWLLEQVREGRFNITAVINLNISEDIARERLRGRAREDDNEAAIDKRFREYKEVTLPILDRLHSAGVPVYDIDGEQDVEKVQQAIIRALIKT